MTFSAAKLSRLKQSIAPAICITLLLAGCSSQTITSQSVVSGGDPMEYTDFVTFPVDVVGHTPTHSQIDIAALFPVFHPGTDGAGRHIVLYVNPAQLGPVSTLCSNPSSFQQGPQAGESATVTGALCDGGTVITTATGQVRTVVPTSKWLMRDFAIIRDQLYQSLAPNLTPKYS